MVSNIVNEKYKTCSICEIRKSIEDFHKRSENGKNGRKSACKICRNKKRKEYAKTNREKENKRIQKWRKDNQDKKLVADRKWRKKNINKVHASDRLWKSKNLHRTSEQAARRRALKKGIEESFAAHDRKLVFARFEHKCFVCAAGLDLTIDHHLPLSGGNALSHDNAVVLCRSCNSSKGTRLPEEFYNPTQLSELENIIKMEQ